MTDQERYLFDLQGFLEIPSALSKEHLNALNSILDQKCADEMPSDASSCRFMGDLIEWGTPYRKLIDLDCVLPYLESILGERFRLDHDYLDVIQGQKGPIGSTLHGGQTPYDSTYGYTCQNGDIRCGLIAIAYNLKDVNPGDGGFGCIPGSHKSNFVFPDQWRNLDTLQPFMRSVTGAAGTAILFTEALMHGTLPWLGDERRTVFFKYAPYAMSWYAQYYDAGQYEDLTDRQRQILEPPNGRYDGREASRPRIRLN
ncbi:MAG: mitomycin antibiotics/polyketide fumonisin biosynthesis protein [Candidatus Latescibacteria bacterium]|nr:mitomycin antibiotics/polyketide fumonisin biosynthesis protein [Candidatus Latescibacterota bacterium]